MSLLRIYSQNQVHAQRALLLIDQTRTSAPVHAAVNDPNNINTRLLTSWPVAASHIFTVLSFDPLTMCLPSGEYATERTQSECPVSVHCTSVARVLSDSVFR
jgi:hypothetical protein